MKQLPENKNLPIHKLVACFNNTVATYKFYWLLSIIEALETRIEQGTTIIPKKELFARMVSNAWYTVNYFRLSFGKQDNLQIAIEKIKLVENLTIEAPKKDIKDWLISTNNKSTLQVLKHFDNEVPHRFLSPWLPGKDKKSIYQLSNHFTYRCPYALHNDFISVDLLWANYFIENAKLIKDFCYWNLVMFLQSKNPNVPDIANKLIKPPFRNSLNKQRKFWNIVFDEKNSIKCIYTKKPLCKDDFAVEHFIPYNFVSHDLIWNLIPADKSFNSKKNDKLPRIEKYFDWFFELQKSAIKIVNDKQPRNKLLEDYYSIIPTLDDIENHFTNIKFKNIIQPLITIANNNGFLFLKDEY